MTKQSIAPDNSLLEQINELFKQLMHLMREQAVLKRKYSVESERLKTQFDRRNSRLQVQIDGVKLQLAKLIDENRSTLISGELKSFVTAFARFSYRKVDAAFKITDKAGALKIARRLKIMKQVCSWKVSYSVDSGKLEKHLRAHPEHLELFADVTERVIEHDSLSAKANDSYLTTHDASRLSAESVNLRT